MTDNSHKDSWDRSEYQQQGYNQQPYGQQPFNQPQYDSQPPYGYPMQKPDNYLVWSILTTAFCFLPFGIVAIVKSTQVDSYWQQRNFDQAHRASESAKKWAIISAITPIAIPVLYFIVLLFIGMIGVLIQLF